MNQSQMDGREFSHSSQEEMGRMLTPIKQLVGDILPDMDSDSQPSYQRTYSQTSPRPIGSLRRRPLIKAQRSPTEIIGRYEDMIKKTLIGWGKAREYTSWKEFSAKLSPEISAILTETFAELRRNGYFNPRVRDDKIIVDYACYHQDNHKDKTLGLCTLCEKECNQKDYRGVFKKDSNGNELKRCWE